MSLFQKLFKRTKVENVDLTDSEVEKIINDYGYAMEHLAPLPGAVADISKLPHPKEKIKKAIVRALQVSNDNHFNDILKFGYLQLADWQENVGKNNLDNDYTNIEAVTPDVVLEQQKAMERWQKIIKNERTKLEEELKSL